MNPLKINKLLWTLLLMLLPEALCAQNNKHLITRVTMVGIGGTNILDTYLSPEHYTGTEARFLSHITRERYAPADSSRTCRWRREMVNMGSLSYSSNRTDDTNYMAARYHFGYYWQRRFIDLSALLSPADHFTLTAGGGADANIGFVYTTQNGNNPAQAHIYLNAAPDAVAEYTTHVGRKQLGIRYELMVPLLGLSFAPNFGQSYYEIFSEGNYDHNIVFTTPFNAPHVCMMLSADYHFSPSTAIRAAYMGDIRQQHANDLKYHEWSHLFMIGVVKRFNISKYRP